MKKIALLSLTIFTLLVVTGNAEEISFNAELDAKVTQLVNLLRDPFAVEYRPARRIQTLKISDGDTVAAAIFTIVGAGGGRSGDQYLAVLKGIDAGVDDGYSYFMDFPRTPKDKEDNPYGIYLIDFMKAGWRGWRSLEDQIVISDIKQGIVITIPTMELGPDDALCCPSQKATAQFQLNWLKPGNRLEEIKPKTEPVNSGEKTGD